MSAFLSRLRTEMAPPSEVKGRNIYTLFEPFIYDSNLLGRIEIGAGLKTNFASIPRLLWRYLDPEDPAIAYASVIHDALYSWGGKLPDGREYTRQQADAVLREAMEISGARIDQRAAAYNAVRLFGSSHWNTL